MEDSIMTRIKLLSLVMALLLVVATFVGCAQEQGQAPSVPTDSNDAPTNNEEPKKNVVYQDVDVNDAITHKDFASVYSKIGSKITIDMVEEDKLGLAFVTYEGVKYELGMDFLSMAMVYNTQVPEGSTKYLTEEDVYNEWWKLYIQRWNYLAPEIPLYSNQYFDVYNAKIQNFVTTPFWGAADAIVAASIKDGEANSVILGSATELSGAFRNSSWGKSSPGSSDLDIENLVSGYATVQTNKEGAFVWNMMALAEEPTKTLNDDGTLTYTIKIKNDLKLSDGSAITAKNYIVGLLANSTPVGVAAGGTGASGLQLVGFDAFKAYEGGEVKEGAARYFEGVKLLGDYEFSVTMTEEYAGYYYSMSYAGYSPSPMALYAPDADIIVDETTKAAGLSDAFYATEVIDDKTTYTAGAKIKANLKWDSALPYSGPYTVKNFDESALIATLELNPNYPGDTARGTASIATITYIKIETETQTDKFKAGEVDILSGITGGAETKAALAIVEAEPEKYAETHYDRAGYGKIGFRADFGPTGMLEVRQAIMYTINRPAFAQAFTGGYGSVVHGPYYEKSAQYQAVKDEIKLNAYTYSKDSAIDVLEEAGWVYNVDGTLYDAAKGGIRYKKLSGYELSAQNITFKTADGKYSTVKIDGEYYMPLAINWYGTQPNEVTDLLITSWQTSKVATEEIGMYIHYTSTTFNTGLYGEYLHIEEYGFDGVWKLNAINFATGFTSAVYDYSWYWTIDPAYYDDYSNCYIMDEADFWENYQK